MGSGHDGCAFVGVWGAGGSKRARVMLLEKIEGRGHGDKPHVSYARTGSQCLPQRELLPQTLPPSC